MPHSKRSDSLPAICERGGVWVWNVRDDIIQADETVSRYYSVPPEEGRRGVPSRIFFQGIFATDRDRVAHSVQHSVLTGEPLRETYRVDSRIYGLRWVQVEGVCFRDPDGRPFCYPGRLLDVTVSSESSEPHVAIVEGLMHSHELAIAAREPMLAKLVEAVLMEAGRRLGAVSCSEQEMPRR
ncbi:PAS domain-containing protein [Aureimonas psammosilenae]|uniref:PAS domain-containing protein n=1 Tax=Aureimonas psammosilenae TaxID=2495496 RepID=UPI0012605FEC|nr:PAS domain-containing protein [Aureimonas psammosilenae]